MHDWIRKTYNAMLPYTVSIGAACLLLVPTVKAGNDRDCRGITRTVAPII